MPIYEYQCLSCGKQFDKLFLSINRISTEITCPTCHSRETRRRISAPTVRTGEGGGVSEAASEPSPAQPPVFGRKELNEALAKKKELRDKAAHGE